MSPKTKQNLLAIVENVVSDVGSVVAMSAYDDVDVCNGVLNCGVLVAAVAFVLTTSKHSHPTACTTTKLHRSSYITSTGKEDACENIYKNRT